MTEPKLPLGFRMYTKDYPDVPEDYSAERYGIVDIESAKDMAQAFVDKFNRTLRRGESPRELLKVELLDYAPESARVMLGDLPHDDE